MSPFSRDEWILAICAAGIWIALAVAVVFAKILGA